MKKGIYIDWETAGSQLAIEDDEIQAEFLKGFIAEIETWDTNMAKEMQLHSVNKLLTERERYLLSCLGLNGGE